jgi:tetratricopeptide (TPR) repeat protein
MVRITQRLGLTRYEADEFYKKGLAAYEKRNLDEALVNLSDAIDALPNHAEYYAARGFVYLEDGIEDKARVDFEQALKLYPYEMLAHYGQGILAYRVKDWETALNHFLNAFRSDQKRPETLYYLALVYHHLNQYENALQVMRQAQTALDANGDKRKTDAGKWVRTLEKLVEQERAAIR